MNVPTAILLLLCIAGGLRGWANYYERDKDFDRAATKYRAVKSAYYAVSDVLSRVGMGDCDEPDETANTQPIMVVRR